MADVADLSKEAIYCRDECPICSRAKRGNKLCKGGAALCRLVCPKCKAYERETGKRCQDNII